MKFDIHGDYFIIETSTHLLDSFLRRTEKNGRVYYSCYWLFAKDFFNRYHIKPPADILSKIKAKINNILQRRKELDGDFIPTEDINRYAKYLNGDYRPYGYQAKAVKYIVENGSTLLADDVGLGKSVQALLVILELLETNNLKTAHIIVPASLRLQWLSEIRKFLNREMFPDVQILVNNKTSSERASMYRRMTKERGQFIMISSYDMVRRDEKKLKHYPFDVVILDEAKAIKTRTTKTNKVIRRLYGDCKYKIAMTATPIENGLEDLYCICEWLDDRLLNSKKYFTEQYCIVETIPLYGRNMTIQKITGYRNLKDARQKIKQLYIRRTVHDVDLELPGVIHSTVNLEMDKAQKTMYDEVTGKIQGDMTREDILGQMIYMQEVCDNPGLISKADEIIDPKTAEIKRMLAEDLEHQKVIIVTRFKEYAKILERNLSAFKPFVISGDTAMEQRQAIIKSFENNSDRRVIIGTEAIEYGLNLQEASVLINADLPWNPAKLKQRMGRIYRIGSEHKHIRMINLVMENSIEERILDVLYEKGVLFEMLFHNDKEVEIKNMLSMGKKKLLDFLKGGK